MFGNDGGNASLEEMLQVEAFHISFQGGIRSTFPPIRENVELRLLIFRGNVVERKRYQTKLPHLPKKIAGYQMCP